MPRFAAMLAIALVASACCVNPVDPPPPIDPCATRGCFDAGPPFPIDAAVPPVPPPDLCGTFEFGEPCERSCARAGLTCFGERRATAMVETDGGVAVLDAVAFPNGMCSIPCRGDTDCTMPGGTCAHCVPYALAGLARLRGLAPGSGVCRPTCDRARACPEGTACDPETNTCLEACTSDEQCRFRTVDSDGDGVEDELVYEPESELVCFDGRCRLAGGAIGDRCVGDDSCEPGFGCLQAAPGIAGRCGRLSCAAGTCGEGAACVRRPDGDTLCALACTIGADAEVDRVGPMGHGAGCDPGAACVWTGAPYDAKAGELPEGACVPGHYNAIAEPNVGAPCVAPEDCWSPFGRGTCLLAVAGATTGVCAVTECEPGGGGLRPDVDVDPPICDATAGQGCVELGDATACATTCTAAEECLPGWACVRPIGADDAVRICSPDCVTDDQCRTGGRCVAPDASTCDAGDRGCACR